MLIFHSFFILIKSKTQSFKTCLTHSLYKLLFYLLLLFYNPVSKLMPKCFPQWDFKFYTHVSPLLPSPFSYCFIPPFPCIFLSHHEPYYSHPKIPTIHQASSCKGFSSKAKPNKKMMQTVISPSLVRSKFNRCSRVAL